jgi:phosphoenolpyruvate synthase/pyruvate phosphate dikinase
MEKKEGLIKARLGELKAFELYRQRFDACPHFMFFLGDAHGSDTNHSSYPYGQRITCAYFSRNKADWLHPMSELQFTADKITELAKTNPDIAKEMIDEFKQWEDAFYEQCHKLAKKDLKRFTDQELMAEYEKLGFLYTKKLNPSPLIDGFSLITDTLISREIEVFLEKKERLKEFIKLFEILTAPTFLSFLQQEEVDLLKIAKSLKTSKNPKKDKDSLLNQHQNQYFWIQNNYVKDKILGLDHFKSKLAGLAVTDIDKRLHEIEQIPRVNKKKKQELITSLWLPKELITLISITDSFSGWQDERKKGTYWATHYFSLLLQEFSDRTGYSLQELKYTMPSEMRLIVEKRIDKEELGNRFNGCMLVWATDCYELTTDKKLIDTIISSQGKSRKEAQKEIRGMSVSLGKACGPVKILESAEEISKVAEGDIIVAVMTRPDYVPAMRKAAGIITDEGGLTCHAAIVARELGIPCIVGTKIATRILKDNDLVEVNANHGTIKVIK